jgi:hypothetical protein
MRARCAGLKLTEKKQGQLSGDPAGYTASGAACTSKLGQLWPQVALACAMHNADTHTRLLPRGADVLYGGSVGHIIGVGIVLGLRATGGL